jgi:hypothetical protein
MLSAEPIPGRFGNNQMSNQRRSNWTPVIVSNFGNPADDSFGSQASSALHPAYTDGFLGEASNHFDPKTQRRADLRFSIGVALALAQPALIGFGIYEAAKSIVLIAS